MSADDKSAAAVGGSALSEGLGPLPEPAAQAVMDLCSDHQGPVDAYEYLPADTMLYTAEQMRAYALDAVAAECERCAKLAYEYATWGGSNFAAWFEKLAAAIRA